MKNDKLVLERVYDAPIETVWKAISDKEQCKQWYFDFSEDWKLETGSEFDWYGGEPDGKQWHHRGKMLEVIKGKKLSHTWEYPGYSGMSTLTWELSPVDKNKTKLILTHEFNVPFDAKEEALRRENFAKGWAHIIHIGLTGFLKNKTK